MDESALALSLVWVGACSPTTANPAMSGPPPVSAVCDSSDPAPSAYLFGWDPGARAKLATLAAEGAVVVHYERSGCDFMLDVLSRCTSRKAFYGYERGPAQDHLSARHAHELRARFPIAASRVVPELAKGVELRAGWMQAGMERLPPGTRIGSEDLVGDCGGATHVVSSISRGAFVLASGRHEELARGGDLLRVAQRSRVRILDRAGDIDACASSHGDLVPGCDVPLRVTLTALGEQAGGDAPIPAACPDGMVPIPAGLLQMGCRQGEPAERPVHAVRVSAYCLGVTEVTVGQYASCVRAGKCSPIDAAQQGRGAGRRER